MQHRDRFVYPVMLILTDFIAIISAFVIAYIVRTQIDARPLFGTLDGKGYVFLISVITPLWLIVFAFMGLYNPRIYEHRLKEFGRLLMGTFNGVLLLIGADYILNRQLFPARLVPVYGFIMSLILLVIGRMMLRLARSLLYYFGIGITNVLIIGNNTAAKNIIEILANSRSSGYRILATVGKGRPISNIFHFKTVDDALEFATGKAHIILQTEMFSDQNLNNRIAQKALSEHIGYRLIPTRDSNWSANQTIELFFGYPLVWIHETALHGWGRINKRLMDIFGSLIAIILLSPVMLVFAIWIKISDGGPVIFKQKRLTRFGNSANVYKFRTMNIKYSGMSAKEAFQKMGRNDLVEKIESGSDGQMVDDPRITKVGQIMRRFGIDELPQLFNVLMGSMSLVGPRAIVPDEIKLYKNAGNAMLAVKTGITGLAQVSGRSDLEYSERARLNLYYIQNWSLLMDIRILLRTVYITLKREGSR